MNAPPFPSEVRIKSGQRIGPKEGTPFCVRLLVEKEKSRGIGTEGRVVPIPEFGGIAYNFRMFDSATVFWWILPQPVEEQGIMAELRAEVWNVSKGEPVELTEVWLSSKVPNGFSNISHFIASFLQE